VTLDQKLIECGIRPLRNHYLPLLPSKIQVFESQLGSPFPTEYKELVSKYGGAVFDKEVTFAPIDPRFRRISHTGWVTFIIIYGDIENDDPWDSNSLQANIEWMKGRMPDTMIPIAATGEDHICLCLHGKDRGALFYWDREEEPTIDNNNIYRIADSIADFISSLKCEEP
jgi:SMI1-KNR4 cell-wall